MLLTAFSRVLKLILDQTMDVERMDSASTLEECEGQKAAKQYIILLAKPHVSFILAKMNRRVQIALLQLEPAKEELKLK